MQNADFERVYDFGNLYAGFLKARRGKRGKASVAKFEANLLEALCLLSEMLKNKTYRPSDYFVFRVYEPKERIVMTNAFKDKVVQHSLCDNILEPAFSRGFIRDNYASQKDRGTHDGLYRLEAFMRSYYFTRKNRAEQARREAGLPPLPPKEAGCADGWVLKCDISKYFYSIQHEPLKRMVRSYVRDPDVLWLTDMIIDSTENPGIPIGNQTSQWFAVMYLSGLDHFIKEKLGIRYYGRYMDDFYLIHEDKAYLRYCWAEIERYVGELGLKLNNKTNIFPLRNGIDFLGFHTYLTDSGKVIRKVRRSSKCNEQRKMKKQRALLDGGKITLAEIEQSYGSWRSHAIKGNCYHLVRETDRTFKNLFKESEKTMAKALSSLAVGALVKDTGTLYNGKPIVWKIADKGHTGYPSGSVTLITEKIISLKCFDAIESGNSDSNRRSYGNNRWIYSNIRQWLNSTAAAGKWYSAQHSADAAPTNANVWSNYNEYDQEAGFLAGFSANFRAALLETTHTVGKASVDGGGTETCKDKIFFASSTEVGLTGDATCGTKLALFSDDNSRKAYPTAECVSKSEYTSSSLNANSPWWWWLADAYASNSFGVRNVHSSGAMNWTGAYNGNSGVRPLCNLSSSILVSDNPDSDGAYTIVWNQAPTVPGSITVPTDVRGGSNLTVSWGTSTDSDGNLSGYILERQHDGGTWTQVYKGINRTYTDAITFGWANVAYRVKAYDSAGAESAYKTSATRTVVNNTAPTISGTDSNLGTKTGAFNQGYSVTDPDSGQTITVVEKIDDVQKRSYTATSGQNYSFNVTAAEWVKLSNGSHKLTITATDNYGGSTTRTYTFTKNETEIELTLSAPLDADDMVTKAIMSVTRQIPAGAEFSVEMCNNGYDASPTWEDVTQAVISGNKIFLQNKTKTAAKWGFNFRIKVNRNGATGDCFIVSAGGNFE